MYQKTRQMPFFYLILLIIWFKVKMKNKERLQPSLNDSKKM